MKNLFKILSVILAVAMLCVMFVMPASAATIAGPEISLGLDQTIFPGEEVTIPVSITNASSIYVMNFEVAVGDLEDVTVASERDDVTAHYDAENKVVKVVCNPTNLSGLASGKLFSIVATVPAAGTAEAYPVTIDSDEIIAADANEEAVAVTGDAINVNPFKITYDNFSLVMGETIDLKLYFASNSAAIDADFNVVYKKTAESESIELNAEKNSKGEYTVKIPRYSFEMAESVYVTAWYNVGETPVYAAEDQEVSVQDYFDKQKDKELDQEVVDCLYAMAKYGEIATKYFKKGAATPSYSNTNAGYQGTEVKNSADIDLAEVLTAAPEVDTTAVEVEGTYDAKLTDGRESLVLASELCFKLYTEIAKDTADTYTYSYGTDLQNLEELPASYVGDYSGNATIKVPVKAYQAGSDFYVKATSGDTVISIVKYTAPDSYIARTWDVNEDAAYTSNDITLKTILSALEIYGDAAHSYSVAQTNS